ncbi:hypothetical protein [Gordonia sp. NPDC058843]|uniref:hypothetical protein n=1 Tax=Gordonia sp. NPDC058843 TaxID=3346648 RepID=UPI0036CFA5D5
MRADDAAVLIGHDWGAMTANAVAHRDDNPYAAVVPMSVCPCRNFDARSLVAYLHGADDGCMRSRFTDHVREVLPAGSAAAVVAGAGHFLHLDRPDEVNARSLALVSSDARDQGVAPDRPGS